MKFDKKKLLTAVSAAALVLAVGACSSSSDDETVAAAAPPPATTEPAPEPTPEMTPAEQLAAAEAAVTIAEALVAALTSSSTGDEAAQAYAALGAAQTALHAATSMPANQIAALQAQISQLALDLEAANATPPTETVALEQAQADAVTAATEAMEAMEAAKVASDAAQTAIENHATLQTGETSRDLADAAYMQAKAAADAAAEAQAASDDAAEATDGVAATRLLVAAETARDNAVEAQGMAETQGAAAVMTAMAELKIDGTVKSVGDATIDAKAPNKVITTTSGEKTSTADTGFQADLEEEATGDVLGRGYTAAVPGGAAEMTYRQDVAARDVTIGKTVDSDNDTTRLAIITSYAGSKTVKVFAYAEDDPEVTNRTPGRVSTTPGKIITNLGNPELIGGIDDAADTTANLRPLGMYYPVSDDGMMNQADALEPTDEVAANARPLAVYSYVMTPATDVAEEVLTYLVEDSQSTEGSTTVYVYRAVNIIVAESRRDGPGDDDVTADAGQVTANIPEAKDYEHIHFGVWASLNAAGINPGGLGIGFVQNYAGAPTEVSDMPNHGSATFDGNWVATIQAADPDGDGTVNLEDGVASMTANFEKMTVEAELTGLATLSGDITGNTFAGTKVSDITHASVSNDADDFMGSTTGGFFGAGAAEAGGVFDFTSDGNEDGAFSGAFGGAR